MPKAVVLGPLMALLVMAAPGMAFAGSGPPPDLPCADLPMLREADLRIITAEEVKPDPVWTTPAVRKDEPRIREVRQPFCRVQAVIEDEIFFELWLPERASWNSRMFGVGNGGFAGFIRYDGLALGVSRGFASISTDTGHKVTEKNWAIGHPRRLENYGHRAQHLVAVAARKVIGAYYGTPVRYSYFLGCSGGGMQGMNLVQRYPADYDGIIAGAHGQSIVGISARWLASALYARSAGSNNVTAADWRRIADTAVQQCDAQDGVTDGIVADPRQCRFDIASTPGLTSEQIRIAKSLNAPILDEKGRELFPGFAPTVAYRPISEPGRPAEAFGHWYYDDPDWPVETFNAARDVPLVENAVPGVTFTNPNLDAFERRGGKLISQHGWTDEILPAQSTIDYHQKVVRFMGQERTDSFYRLFLAPGVDHCDGGAGADLYTGSPSAVSPVVDPDHDMLEAIVAWVEQGKAPDRIVASRMQGGKVVMTRPLCPYPQIARYDGKGDPDVAASFRCEAP